MAALCAPGASHRRRGTVAIAAALEKRFGLIALAPFSANNDNLVRIANGRFYQSTECAEIRGV